MLPIEEAAGPRAAGLAIVGYVVRHHAAEKVDLGFSFIPVVDLSTHTFGGSIELRPDQLDLEKIGRFVNRMHRNQIQ